MAIPQWTYNSNTSLGVFEERRTLDIPILVFDSEDRSTIETSQFENNIDSSIVPNYANEFYFWIKSNGLPRTALQSAPPGYNDYTATAQSYVFKFPRQRSIETANKKISTSGFIGVAIDGVPFKSPNSGIVANINGKNYTENRVIYPFQNHFTDGSGIIDSSRKFYYHCDPKLLYTKTAGHHSSIIGYAFDGNPIYGPYGYSDPTNPSSGVKIMSTSYRLKYDQRSNGTIPDGTYIEDFEYVEGLGDLDQYNGRFCITPDYPGGVYAYFITVDSDNVNQPRYPYIIGPQYRNQPILPNGSFDFPGDLSISVLSGKLPPGLRISGLNIVGVPFEVSSEKTFKFVLRAKNLDGISDRTFLITISGADSPIWVTPQGDLPVGVSGDRIEIIKRYLRVSANAGQSFLEMRSVFEIPIGSSLNSVLYSNSLATDTRVTSIDLENKILTLSKTLIGGIPAGQELNFLYTYKQNNLYILDNSFINYQLLAIDNDVATSQNLRYYIPPKGGILPPGITLTEDGVLTGFVEAVVAADQGDLYGGNYDMNFYDKYSYDYTILPYDGYDSFFYDNVIFDFSNRIRTPKKLNRYYEFVVRASDGVSYTDRKFRIFVVGDDYFRSDTTRRIGTGTYTADATYLRKPIWTTPKKLGVKRANNYITFFLDVYNPSTLGGQLGFILLDKNEDGSNSVLPPGLMLDQISGEIYGDVPYQPAITKTYKFTISAIVYDPQSTVFGVERYTSVAGNIGSYTLKLDSVSDIRVNSFVTSPTGTAWVGPSTVVTAINSATRTITLSKPLLQSIPSNEKLIFSYVISSPRTFEVDILGEVDSTISFITSGDLGEIPANYTSNLAVEAKSNVKNAILSYSLVGGKIPPGLILFKDGTLQGKVNQYSKNDALGLTSFDNNTTSFDEGTTTSDREYIFTIKAEDQFKFSATTKTFTVKVITPNNLLYSNIYVKPFLNSSKRTELTDFFTNPYIFERNYLYRPNDQAFGVQTELKMLLYAGIETKEATEYVSALGRSTRKRYKFGEIKKAIAKIPGTNTVIYEAVYIDIIDNMENSNGSIPEIVLTKNLSHPLTTDQGKRDTWDSSITDNNILKSSQDELSYKWLQDKVLTADYSGQFSSDLNKSNIFGNSTTNIRKKISEIGLTERNFLPLWMRTPQSYSGIEQGFTKGIVLCYCQPNGADRIITNIKNLGIDFKTIDFTVDRVIIDSIKGETGDKYIAFAAREVING